MNSKVETRCLACNSIVLAELRNLSDTRYGIDNSYGICNCPACGLSQTVPVPSSIELEKLYETYYSSGTENGSAYASLRERFFRSDLYRIWLTIDGDMSFHGLYGSGRLLDIGCNEGRGLRICQQNGFEVEGLEPNERAATEARKRGFRVHTSLLGRFNPQEPYDVVVLSNVLEHSLQPKEMLSHVARILKPNGQVWISCPNTNSWQRLMFDKYWINWHIPFHIVHFSPQTLGLFLRQAGFKVISSKQITPALWIAQSIIARLFAKPGVPTRQLRNPFLVAFLMLLARGLFFPILWLGNRLGRGDCLVAIARKGSNSCGVSIPPLRHQGTKI